MKKPLLYSLLLCICLTGCNEENTNKTDVFHELIFTEDFLDIMVWETEHSLALAKMNDPVRHGILYNYSRKLHDAVNSTDYLTNEEMFTFYNSLLSEIELELSKRFHRELDLKNDVYKQIGNLLPKCNSNEFRSLLQLHLATVNSSFNRLQLHDLLVIDSLSFSTTTKGDSVLLVPQFFNKTQNARLIIDTDTSYIQYGNLKIQQGIFNKSKYIAIQFKSADGLKWMHQEIKNEAQQSI
jgi:hypothetical protein